MALPTKEEQEVLKGFRQIVADVLTPEESKDDMFILRWLRARDLNLEKAEDMLRNAKKWRKENNVDSVVLGDRKNLFYAKNFPKYFNGADRDGRPVIGVPIGKWDVRRVVRDGKSTEFISYLTQCFEEVMYVIKTSRETKARKGECNEIEQKHTAPVTQVIVILDWDGFAWGQLFSYQCVQNFLQIGQIYEAFYPEILFQGYFVNCPSLISAVLTLLKPILAPKTMAKIKVFGTDRKEWEEALLQYIDEDQLSPQLGGTRDCDVHDPFYHEVHRNIEK